MDFNMKSKYIVYVGIVGQIAGGKGILVKYLTERLGFVSFSLSSILHNELKKKGIKEFTRKTLQDMGDELRKKEGDDVLAKLIIKKIRSTKPLLRQDFGGQVEIRNYVIEGIRNPGEIEFLKKNTNFVLIGVKAKRKLRFKRLLSRGKEWDPQNYNDFLKVDRRDLGVGQKRSGQQVEKCLAYCDFVLTNNKDVKDFERKIKNLASSNLRGCIG